MLRQSNKIEENKGRSAESWNLFTPHAGDETAQTVEFLRYANMQESRFLKKEPV